MFKSAIRVNKIKTVAQLRGLSLHAERHDEIGQARVREGAVAGEALAWSKAETSDRDYLAAFKAHISTQKPLNELKAATGERNEYAALQTSWAEWCQEHLDHSITRGLRRDLTAREHLSPETYGAVLDKAREAVQRPAQSVLGALQAADLSWEDTDRLRDYLLLRGEISRHKEDPHAYEPPPGSLSRDTVEEERLYEPNTWKPNTWKLITALRQGADQVLEAAYRFRLGFDTLSRPDGHEAGRKWFPSLVDRLHLGAVIAKCGVFCAQAEAFVKNLRIEDPAQQLKAEELWPEESFELVERYNRHLGLDLPQHSQTLHERQQEQARGIHEAMTAKRERSHDDDYDHGL